MIDLLERADPARDANPDFIRLRAKVDERIHRPTAKPGIRRPWLNAAIAFGAVSAIVALVAILRLQQPSIYAPRLDGLGEVPGIEDVVKLASGGVQTAAVDGDTIWVVTALANLLQRISAVWGELEMTYAIDSHVEGVVIGGGYVWLLTTVARCFGSIRRWATSTCGFPSVGRPRMVRCGLPTTSGSATTRGSFNASRRTAKSWKRAWASSKEPDLAISG
ncbi:hypothetical protein BH18ACT6_BH18ACT6_11850 [soil metagenome]